MNVRNRKGQHGHVHEVHLVCQSFPEFDSDGEKTAAKVELSVRRPSGYILSLDKRSARLPSAERRVHRFSGPLHTSSLC